MILCKADFYILSITLDKESKRALRWERGQEGEDRGLEFSVI